MSIGALDVVASSGGAIILSSLLLPFSSSSHKVLINMVRLRTKKFSI